MGTYEDVRKTIATGTSHLLVGNGFSIACDKVFQYGSLYDTAVQTGLSARAQKLFGFLGTNNFEGARGVVPDATGIQRRSLVFHGLTWSRGHVVRAPDSYRNWRLHVKIVQADMMSAFKSTQIGGDLF